MLHNKLVGIRSDGNIGAELDGQLDTIYQSTGTYVGGQPVGLGPSGLVFGEDLYASCCMFLGAFVNNSLIDTKNGGGNANATETDLSVANPSVCYPGNKIGVDQNSIQGDTSTPYENVNWQVGDDVFVSSGGLWTNVSGGGCTQSWGKVIVVPSSYGDELVFIFNSYVAC